LVFSAKTEYGLVALIEIAAKYGTGGVTQGAEIAARQAIPDRYLEQLLTSLRRGGILHSIRGPKGGYQLARPPAEISVAEVVSCLDGSQRATPQTRRQSLEFEALQDLNQQLNAARQALLENTTLATLIAQRDSKARDSAMYFI
jgi:Rrf2 family protein